MRTKLIKMRVHSSPQKNMLPLLKLVRRVQKITLIFNLFCLGLSWSPERFSVRSYKKDNIF